MPHQRCVKAVEVALVESNSRIGSLGMGTSPYLYRRVSSGQTQYKCPERLRDW